MGTTCNAKVLQRRGKGKNYLLCLFTADEQGVLNCNGVKHSVPFVVPSCTAQSLGNFGTAEEARNFRNNIKLNTMKIFDVEFHDMPLKEITFLLETQEIIVGYNEYSEDNEGYINRKIRFEGIENLTIICPQIRDVKDMDIFSIDEEIIDGIKRVICIFTGGHSTPNMELSFEFQKVFLDDLEFE